MKTDSNLKWKLIAALLALMGIVMAGGGLALYWGGDSALLNIADANARTVAEWLFAGKKVFVGYGLVALLIALVVARFGPDTPSSDGSIQ